MSKVKILTDDNFFKEIEKGLVLVDFNASWCGPCRMLSPIVTKLAQHFENKAIIAKIDIDAQQKIAAEYQVTSVPTLILFKNGKEINRLVGLRTEDEIKKLMEDNL